MGKKKAKLVKIDLKLSLSFALCLHSFVFGRSPCLHILIWVQLLAALCLVLWSLHEATGTTTLRLAASFIDSI